MAAANNPADLDLKMNMSGSDGAKSAMPQQGYPYDMSSMFGE